MAQNGGKNGNRVKDAAEIDQRQDDEVGVHRQRIKIIGVNCCDNAELGEKKAGQAGHGDCGKRMRPGKCGKQAGDQPDDQADGQAAHHGGQGVGHDKLALA